MQPRRHDHEFVQWLPSNLLGNALTHGASTRPVLVRATSRRETFELSVTNGGEPIPPGALATLFQPFFRVIVTPNQGRFGLGFYIAKADRGTLDAASSPQETRFTFSMPAGV
ncbi:sensor histidine kinase [Lichenicola cladoniae]|uniref:sensor histidine kinase n=1 Tax=Lichenicola cladoniae TaxID=1484109 RepID=UPI0019543926|nr:ATP-binding protein [Lichenicola cladoniae]